MPQPDHDIHASRVFVATPIDETARGTLVKAQNAMQRSGANVRWMAPLNIHLTLVFLGNIFNALVASIREALLIQSRLQPQGHLYTSLHASRLTPPGTVGPAATPLPVFLVIFHCSQTQNGLF